MISVIIPTYEQKGQGHIVFRKLLDSICIQDCLQIVQVVVSDNSVDDKIQRVCNNYQQRLSIKYVRNPVRGVSANTNNAINHADHDMIKVMYMDDLLLTPHALTKFMISLKKHMWSFSDSIHINADGKKTTTVSATFNPKTILQFNSIGMPSVIAFRKSELRFDERLKTCLDNHFYLQLFRMFGHGCHIEQCLIAQRFWRNQLSANQPDFKTRDIELLKREGQLS